MVNMDRLSFCSSCLFFVVVFDELNIPIEQVLKVGECRKSQFPWLDH